MKQAAIIIPTTGSALVKYAIESAISQTYKNTIVYLVVDGSIYYDAVNSILKGIDIPDNLKVYYLPENTGANGQNGHRIYSAFSFLSSADYLFYLDQDCFYDENHVESSVDLIESKDLKWSFSLRKIVSVDGNYLCNDDCESLGHYKPVFNYNLCDTGTYCVTREVAMLVSPYFVGDWGHDRRYYEVLSRGFPKFSCTGKYTLNYRLGGDNNLKEDFWKHWNEKVEVMYNGKLPWRENG